MIHLVLLSVDMLCVTGLISEALRCALFFKMERIFTVSLCQIEQYSFYFNAKKRVDYKFTKERNLKTINSRFKLGSFTEEKKLKTI